jgi:CRP-like cAMP-binding protein
MNFYEFLQTVPDFDIMSTDDIETLEKVMLVRDYPDGYEFIQENTVGHDIYLVVEGCVAVTHKKGKSRGLLDMKHLYPGELFGLISLIDDGKHEASCRAIGPVKAASLPRSTFKLLYESNSPLARHFQHIVSQQLMRDYRTLINLLRSVIFAETEKETNEAVNAILYEYHGTERRMAERRSSSNETAH